MGNAKIPYREVSFCFFPDVSTLCKEIGRFRTREKRTLERGHTNATQEPHKRCTTNTTPINKARGRTKEPVDQTNYAGTARNNNEKIEQTAPVHHWQNQAFSHEIRFAISDARFTTAPQTQVERKSCRGDVARDLTRGGPSALRICIVVLHPNVPNMYVFYSVYLALCHRFV